MLLFAFCKKIAKHPVVATDRPPRSEAGKNVGADLQVGTLTIL